MRAITPEEVRLRTIWQALPTTPLTEDELFAAILKAAGGYEHDHAMASALRSSLIAVEVLSVRRTGTGECKYIRSETWPDLSDRGFGSESHKESIRQQAQAEKEHFEKADRLAWNISPQKREREELIALIDERIEEKLTELISLDKPTTVTELREWITSRRRKNAA